MGRNVLDIPVYGVHRLVAETLPARPQQRRFRAYNVGIAKTGTRSVAGIFANYRSLHEFLLRDTVRAVDDRACGAISEREFRDFIRWRDGLTRLDMDSSSFNCYYVDVLAEEFPDARFVFVIRDCFSWLDSFLNMVFYGLHATPGYMLTGYMQKFLGPGFEPELAECPDRLRQELPAMINSGLRYWSRFNQFVVDNLPLDRSLVLRTHELSTSLPRLARLVGVNESTLVPDLVQLNGARKKYHFLQAVDAAVLSDGLDGHCRELMREFFPGVTLAGFLARDRSS